MTRLVNVACLMLWSVANLPSLVWGWKLNFARRERDEESVVAAVTATVPSKEIDGCQFPVNSAFDAVQCSSLSEPNVDLISIKMATQLLLLVYERFKRVLSYKPPVGVVAAVAVTRLLWSGRIFPFRNNRERPRNVEDALFLQRQHEKRWGRSLNLDVGDSSYVSFGGIECVRRRLCLAVISDSLLMSNLQSNSSQTSEMTFRNAASEALQVSSQPTEPWVKHIHALLESMLRMERGLPSFHAEVAKYSQTGHGSNGHGLDADQCSQFTSIVVTTIHLCLMDAMVRLCRDRVLQTAYRLARTCEYWERRVDYSQTVNLWFRNLFTKSIEQDRMCLSLARAAYRMEVVRLGKITTILWNRPPEMSEAVLVRARKATDARAYKQQARLSEVDSDTRQTPTRHQFLRDILRKWKLPAWSDYSLRWRADGKGFLSIRRFNDADAYIDGPSALAALLTRDVGAKTDGSRSWETRAQEWIKDSQRGILQTIQECLESSSASSVASGHSQESLRKLEAKWCGNVSKSDGDLESVVRCAVSFINTLSTWRRVGEGEKVRLRDLFGVRDWVAYLDFFGVPLTALYIYVALQFYERFVKLHWPTLRQESNNVALKVGEIIQQRVWIPLKEIYDDIMNKAPTLMSALGLEAEESSLDQMLLDLNFGDGTPSGRQDALQKATKQYERDLSTGLFTNLARGRLVRLLLIQVQQLKVGMLSALETIDLLLQGNRIHFKILAAIPMLVLTTYGTRYFLRALYNIRAKDLRPVRAVHSEMAHYLNRVEQIILLSGSDPENENGDSPVLLAQTPTPVAILQLSELGELMVNMHRYLVLLDFCRPLFPRWNCDQIHLSLRQLTGPSGALMRLDRERQLQWVNRVKQDHQGLAKYL